MPEQNISACVSLVFIQSEIDTFSIPLSTNNQSFVLVSASSFKYLSNSFIKV